MTPSFSGEGENTGKCGRMLGFITDNLGTIAVGLVLAVVVFLIIRSLVKDRKEGKFICGGDCAHCRANCRSNARQNTEIKRT